MLTADYTQSANLYYITSLILSPKKEIAEGSILYMGFGEGEQRNFSRLVTKQRIKDTGFLSSWLINKCWKVTYRENTRSIFKSRIVPFFIISFLLS